MGIFNRTPRELRNLDMELAASQTAFAVAPRLSVEHQQHVATVALHDVPDAARKAAAAGHGGAARDLVLQYADQHDGDGGASAGHTWQEVIDASLEALNDYS